ncbi:RNA-directed DNA polymerase from mobile element jockey [Merluccius polli]|uniref:RNA-directed DNA polymerase from mobile element jockey n=1 Tax=Merluccius polli TaxID=89951 RepID=A0AA47MM97_MERPO|nr:RNA-directed DNA polymerase from mobile element jockey [Merluccius polli]
MKGCRSVFRKDTVRRPASVTNISSWLDWMAPAFPSREHASSKRYLRGLSGGEDELVGEDVQEEDKEGQELTWRRSRGSRGRVLWVSVSQARPSWTRVAMGLQSSVHAMRDQGLRTEPCSWTRTTRCASQLTPACMSSLGFWGRSLGGSSQAYSTSRANLKRGIKKAKHEYKLKVEEHFVNSDPRRMWQGIQAITDYKPSNSSPSVMDMPFLQELNNFYARFDKENKDTATKTELSDALSKINARKAAGPDGIPGRVLRACAEQLAGVLTDIFNLSLAQAAVPACFKTTSIVPVPKHSSPSCLNDYRPVALTPIVMKCFERLVLAHLKKCLPTSLDPHQFAYQNNRSTDDARCTVLSHLDNKNTYARLLFVDFSSAFNTVIPSKLITKLGDLGISTPLCNWILDFLTNRPQHVRSGHDRSTTLILNTGAPQGCVLSPFLYSLFTHDCKPKYGSNSIIKFADDTTVIGLITNNDESDYRAEVQHLAVWCADNNLLLNTSKTKELIVDFRKKKGETHNPIHINGMAVERVSSFKFLGTYISENLTWAINTSSLVKKANQRLFFLRTLKKNHLSADILCNFYRCAIESILTNCITAWYGNCSVADRKSLQQVVKTAQRVTGTPLPAIEVVRKKRCLNRARSILKDPSHPANGLFQLLPSRRRFRSLQTKTSRFRNSFFPTAVSLLNSVPR